MPIIEFGPKEPLLTIGVRGAFGGSSPFVVPRFGTTCVCCNQDAMGRTQDYDPSTDRIVAPAVPMPVCFACRDHAFQGHTGPILAASGFCVGLAALLLGAIELADRPHDSFLWGLLVLGIALLSLSLFWIARSVQRERRDRAIPGHHARLWFTVGQGATRIVTRNETLADELVTRNRAARRIPTRAEAKQLPTARALDK